MIDRHMVAAHRRTRMRMAAFWLLAGCALLVLTPLPAWTPTLGWAPLLTLVVSPVAWTLLHEPALPLRLLATPRSRRPMASANRRR